MSCVRNPFLCLCESIKVYVVRQLTIGPNFQRNVQADRWSRFTSSKMIVAAWRGNCFSPKASQIWMVKMHGDNRLCTRIFFGEWWNWILDWFQTSATILSKLGPLARICRSSLTMLALAAQKQHSFPATGQVTSCFISQNSEPFKIYTLDVGLS